MTKLLIKLILVVVIDLSLSYGPFPIAYIGNYLTIAEYNNLTLCSKKVCLMDSQRLLEYATYMDVDPCKSFQNYSCGTFYQERALSERYESIGFERNLELQNDEKKDRALKKPVTDEDGKAVRIVKNFYQKCVNWSEVFKVSYCAMIDPKCFSGHIEKVSRKDVLNYLNSFGKFPLLNQEWKESDLNFTKLFNEVKLEYLVNMRVNFCPHPITREDVACIYVVEKNSWKRYKKTSSGTNIKDIKDMLRALSIPLDGVEEMVRHFYETSLMVIGNILITYKL